MLESCRANACYSYSANYCIHSGSSFCNFTIMNSITEFQLFLGRFRMVAKLLTPHALRLFLRNQTRQVDTCYNLMNALPKLLEAYLAFVLTYPRFLNYKLQQSLEESQFFLGRFRMVAPLFMHCCFFYEIIDTASSHSLRQITYFYSMNASPKQVEAYQDFILTKRGFLICKYTKLSVEFGETAAHLKELMLL